MPPPDPTTNGPQRQFFAPTSNGLTLPTKKEFPPFFYRQAPPQNSFAPLNTEERGFLPGKKKIFPSGLKGFPGEFLLQVLAQRPNFYRLSPGPYPFHPLVSQTLQKKGKKLNLLAQINSGPPSLCQSHNSAVEFFFGPRSQHPGPRENSRGIPIGNNKVLPFGPKGGKTNLANPNNLGPRFFRNGPKPQIKGNWANLARGLGKVELPRFLSLS